MNSNVVFIWRKYKEECLWFKGDKDTKMVTLDQRSIHKTDCWGFFEWPFFLFNGAGLIIHFGLLVGLLIRVFLSRNDTWFAEEQVNFRSMIRSLKYFSVQNKCWSGQRLRRWERANGWTHNRWRSEVRDVKDQVSSNQTWFEPKSISLKRRFQQSEYEKCDTSNLWNWTNYNMLTSSLFCPNVRRFLVKIDFGTCKTHVL